MTRVIHTGDTHIGYRQYHLPARRSDFLAAFRSVVDDAIDDDVDAVVHAGDLFHDRRPDLQDLLGTLDVLRELDDADIPFLAIVGNHETTRDGQWLDLFETMGLARRLGREPTRVGDVAFYGLDYVPRASRAALEYDFAPTDAPQAALVAHGLFAPLVSEYGEGAWDAATVLDDSPVAFDAMLLGDEHAPRRQQVADTWVTYCGSTERVSAAERDDRGYNIVEFDVDAGDVHITRRGIETREFVYVDLELAVGEGAERVTDRLDEHDLTDAVVVVTLSGEGEAVTPAEIEAHAEAAGALTARVTDHRELATDVDIEVSFADPDAAVRERIGELGLSRAARDIDETVRASKIADANVADEVERRVAELLDDPAAFEPGPDESSDDTVDAAGTDTDATPSPPEEPAGTTGDGEPTAADDTTADSRDEDDPEEVVEATGTGGEDQASMEEYL